MKITNCILLTILMSIPVFTQPNYYPGSFAPCTIGEKRKAYYDEYYSNQDSALKVPKRKYFAFLFGGGLKYYFSHPTGWWYDDHPEYASSAAGMASVELILNRKENHFLGVEVLVFRGGEKYYSNYKNETYLATVVGYRFRMELHKGFSASAKMGVIYLPTEPKYFLHTQESLQLEYQENRFVYFIAYKTDFIFTTPNFIISGVGFNL